MEQELNSLRRAEARKRHREEVRVYLDQYKSVNPCKGCGETDIEKLTFHHRCPDDKNFNLGNGTHHSWEKVKMELMKCDVLCIACHRKLDTHLAQRAKRKTVRTGLTPVKGKRKLTNYDFAKI